jgi:hypothetical protein
MMNSKKWLVSLAASLFAVGAVSLGSALEPEAVAANQSWDYYEECHVGCSREEDDEYYRNGAYGQEVQSEPGPGNREEMLELARHSTTWCSNMFYGIARTRLHLYNYDMTCREARLGW